ncbi:MAG: anhydro-N-acetylmuramic acid kinase [Pirellulales bacterium]|nr:anhydro-N-acetylmuramic acid kinase [Pirellulales bacterium]
MRTSRNQHASRAPDAVRWTLGVHVGSGCRSVGAALVSAHGRGLDARVTVRAFRRDKAPDETARLFRQIAAGAPSAFAPDLILQLRAELTELEAKLVDDLPGEIAGSAGNLLAVGVDDPGLWAGPGASPAGVLGLCDAARLAESTGANVIDALPARDLARRGQGGPLTPMAQWILLSAPDETRLIVDLGRTTRMTLLPASREINAPSRVLGFDVGPGTELLDVLARQLTSGAHAFDPGGRLAVQGRRIELLLAHWLLDPVFEQPLPKWHPRGVRPERFLNDALRMAVDGDWSVRDLLCTATHLIAESIAQAIERRLPGDLPIARIVLAGGGCHNGMLLRELAARLSAVPFSHAEELGIPEGALEPASVAVLALCHVDQVPGNPTAVTGAEVPRVLGCLTPGSPQNWQRIVQEMASARPALRPLRSAI